jgi:hypothetical protein
MASGNYTGERLADQNPRKYREIIRLLSEGISINRICKSTKSTHGTIEAIQRIEAQTITERKRSLANVAARVARSAIHQIEDNLANRKYQATHLPIVFGVATDKLLLLSDQATETIHHSVTVEGNIFHAFAQFHADAKRIINARTLPDAYHPQLPQDASNVSSKNEQKNP